MLLLVPLLAVGQDLHFSQLDINPVLLNPSYVGFFDGSGRLGIIYRNQWASVSHPYQTLAATGEISLLRNRYKRYGLNAGIFAYSDKAGTLGYGTKMASVTASFFHSLNGKNNNYLSVGLEAGYAISGYDPTNAESLDNGEQYNKTSTNYFLLGAGLAWFYQPNNQLILRTGLSVRNINRPNISYLKLDNTHLEPKLNGYVRIEHRTFESVSLLPVAAMQWLNGNKEILYGIDAKWYVNEAPQQLFALSAGVLMRHGDALVMTLQAEYNALLVALSYDANISHLATASHTLGAFELSVLYRFIRHKTNRRKAIPCPVM